jgi:hypothetical protein
MTNPAEKKKDVGPESSKTQTFNSFIANKYTPYPYPLAHFFFLFPRKSVQPKISITDDELFLTDNFLKRFSILRFVKSIREK